MSNAQTRPVNRLHIVPPAPSKPRGDTTSQHTLSGLLITLFDTIGTCFDRTSQRRSLTALDDWMLRDIGLSRYDIETKAMKPFWIR
jgi:uncharacterized protein YjiS (DUF1127 family)